MNKNEITIQVYEDGMRILFSLTHLPEFRFQTLTNHINHKRNEKKIQVFDLFLDKEGVTTISVLPIEDYPLIDFVKILECELMQTIVPQNIKGKMLDDYRNLE
jgi:hypothetical protein